MTYLNYGGTPLSFPTAVLHFQGPLLLQRILRRKNILSYDTGARTEGSNNTPLLSIVHNGPYPTQIVFCSFSGSF